MEGKKIDKMDIIELLEYCVEGKKHEPRLEDRFHSIAWSENVRKRILDSSELTRLKALDVVYKDVEYLDEEIDIRDSIAESLVGDLYERVKLLETTVQLLMDELGGKQSKLSIKDINALKGGF